MVCCLTVPKGLPDSPCLAGATCSVANSECQAGVCRCLPQYYHRNNVCRTYRIYVRCQFRQSMLSNSRQLSCSNAAVRHKHTHHKANPLRATSTQLSLIQFHIGYCTLTRAFLICFRFVRCDCYCRPNIVISFSYVSQIVIILVFVLMERLTTCNNFSFSFRFRYENSSGVRATFLYCTLSFSS